MKKLTLIFLMLIGGLLHSQTQEQIIINSFVNDVISITESVVVIQKQVNDIKALATELPEFIDYTNYKFFVASVLLEYPEIEVYEEWEIDDEGNYYLTLNCEDALLVVQYHVRNKCGNYSYTFKQ